MKRENMSIELEPGKAYKMGIKERRMTRIAILDSVRKSTVLPSKTTPGFRAYWIASPGFRAYWIASGVWIDTMEEFKDRHIFSNIGAGVFREAILHPLIMEAIRAERKYGSQKLQQA